MNMKKIVIYQGDENRAKIEKELSEEIFFAEVYKKALTLVKELIEEAKEYKQSAEYSDCKNARYQRMGNNIIAFCARRGQGKTTAMKSFARFLSNGYEGKNKLLDKQVLKENEFVVLDSIDPAALDNGESLIRVVISRLFYRLDKMYQQNLSMPLNDKNRILELFQQCYRSIDYLHGKKQEGDRQDDLESLAALGNSAKLKRDLMELIDLFLKNYLDKEEGKNTESGKNRFLVIPIDDVDICTADIYRCCEEIRNYLTLPNVIILLAADHTQLHHVIYQKYLQINKEMLYCEPEVSKVECNKQASGYLLKLVPNNHIVDLPEIDKMSEGKWDNLQLVYLTYQTENGKKEYIDIFEQWKDLNEQWKDLNMKQQLIKLIYERTGIVLWDNEGAFWKFLPQTMRELTQLIKQLVSRPVIDQKELYRSDLSGKRVVNEDKIAELSDSIQLFKSYFLNSWCVNHISHEQCVNFKNWVDNMEISRKKGRISWKFDKTWNQLYKRNESSEEGDGSKSGKGGANVQADFPPENIPLDVISMYLTIFLNEWFVEALRDEKQYSKIVDFLDVSFGTQIEGLPNSKGYKFYSFSVDKGLFNKIDIHEEFKKLFCRSKGGEVYFDILNPWMHILEGGYDKKNNGNGMMSSEDESMETPAEDVNQRTDLRLTFKDILANVGIYQHVIGEMKRKYIESPDDKEFDWREGIIGIYNQVKAGIEQLDYLHLNQEGISQLINWVSGLTDAWKLMFILNFDNRLKYYDEYKEMYGWILETRRIVSEKNSNVFNFIRAYKNTEMIIAPNFMAEYAEKISENVLGEDYRLQEMVLSQKVISSKKTEIDEILKKELKTAEDQKSVVDLLNVMIKEFRRIMPNRAATKQKPKNKDQATKNRPTTQKSNPSTSKKVSSQAAESETKGAAKEE